LRRIDYLSNKYIYYNSVSVYTQWVRLEREPYPCIRMQNVS
jgi:hypothetical protein